MESQLLQEWQLDWDHNIVIISTFLGESGLAWLNPVYNKSKNI